MYESSLGETGLLLYSILFRRFEFRRPRWC